MPIPIPSLPLTRKQPLPVVPHYRERVQISLHCLHYFHFRDESVQVGGRSEVSVGSNSFTGGSQGLRRYLGQAGQEVRAANPKALRSIPSPGVQPGRLGYSAAGEATASHSSAPRVELLGHLGGPFRHPGLLLWRTPHGQGREILCGEHPAVCPAVADVACHAFVDTEMLGQLRNAVPLQVVEAHRGNLPYGEQSFRLLAMSRPLIRQ